MKYKGIFLAVLLGGLTGLAGCRKDLCYDHDKHALTANVLLQPEWENATTERVGRTTGRRNTAWSTTNSARRRLPGLLLLCTTRTVRIPNAIIRLMEGNCR